MPKNQNKPHDSLEQRARRRNQIIFLLLSAVIILAMLLSLVRF